MQVRLEIDDEASKQGFTPIRPAIERRKIKGMLVSAFSWTIIVLGCATLAVVAYVLLWMFLAL